MALGPLQEAWVKALESGEYQQGQGRLVTVVSPDQNEEQEQCCCLGVLCLMAGLDRELLRSGGLEARYLFTDELGYKEQFYLPQSLVKKYSLFNHKGDARGATSEEERTISLAHMNDKGDSFAQIAAKVRERPDWFFSEEV